MIKLKNISDDNAWLDDKVSQLEFKIINLEQNTFSISKIAHFDIINEILDTYVI